jgi:hypothetical protein
MIQADKIKALASEQMRVADWTPFRDWVPKPLGVLILLLMFFPPTFSGGAYVVNVSEMAGGLGLWTEDVQMASQFVFIGMSIFLPMMSQYLQVRRPKQTYLYCFTVLTVFNFICAITTSMPVLLLSCMVIGFARIIVMLNCTMTLLFYVTGINTADMFTMKQMPKPELQGIMDHARGLGVPIIYFYVLLIFQTTNLVTAWFAYHYTWQYTYFFVDGMLLVGMLLIVLTMRDEEETQTYNIEWHKVPDLLLMGIFMGSLAIFMGYGDKMDWLSSTSMRVALVVMLLSGGLFCWRASRQGKDGYLRYGIFNYRNVWVACFLFLATIILNFSNTFVGAYAKISTPINDLKSASLYGWAIVGLFCGLVLSLLLGLRRAHYRVVFVVSLLLMVASNVYLYFQIQTDGYFPNLIWPMILEYAALVMVYSLPASFGMLKLPPQYLVTFVFLMIGLRNGFGPILGSSAYNTWLTHKQQHYVTRLATKVDHEHPAAEITYQSAVRQGMGRGMGTYGASQLATTAVKGRVVKQATLVAMKDICGTTILLLLGVTTIVILIPYHKQETV